MARLPLPSTAHGRPRHQSTWAVLQPQRRRTSRLQLPLAPHQPNLDEELAYTLAKWFPHSPSTNTKASTPVYAYEALEVFRNYLDRSPLPIHEGTVRYLKEIGAWN